ncbi:hypothetical protein [Paenibacillus sp. GYB003]|uniref:hypothetical protein n=1 Tax=Paenibacillus sp. GYB003 TaxID=2994392 RepID=UPI002F963967
MTQSKEGEKRDAQVDFWWVKLPLAMRRWSPQTTMTLADGYYLTAWPALAKFAPPVALLLGLLFGQGQWGYEHVFSESIVVMALAVAFGTMSGHLGAMFVLGFAVGDFFVAHNDWTENGYRIGDGLLPNALHIRIPLLISYVLLGVMAMRVPLAAKALLMQLTPPQRFGRTARFRYAVVVHALLSAGLTLLWTQSVPVLVRPVFAWAYTAPSVESVATLQKDGIILVAFAVLASVIRMNMQGMTASRPELGSRLDAVQERLAAAPPVSPVSIRRYPWARSAMRAIGTTLMLSGIYSRWLDGVFMGVFLLLLQAARDGTIRVPLGKWPDIAGKIPLLLRLASGMLIIYLTSGAILELFEKNRTIDFRPLLLQTAFALLVLYALNPRAASAAPSGKGGDGS